MTYSYSLFNINLIIFFIKFIKFIIIISFILWAALYFLNFCYSVLISKISQYKKKWKKHDNFFFYNKLIVVDIMTTEVKEQMKQLQFFTPSVNKIFH